MSISIQKANFWKRFSAWLVDAVAVFFVSLGVFILACILVNTDALKVAYQNKIEPYKTAIETEFSIDLDLMGTAEYQAMEQAERDAYDALYEKAQDAFNEKIKADKDALELYNNWLTQVLTAGIIAILTSHLLLNFCVPLILKNGQTLGKKTFGLAVIRTNGVKVNGKVLFVRQFIGLCAIETMAVLYMCTLIPVGLITALLVQALQVGVMIKTPTNSSIHDLLADTVVVELASQQIFETEEARAQFIANESAEGAAPTADTALPLPAETTENEENTPSVSE